MTVTRWLERARDASSDAEALVALLGAWRAAPCVALAELVAAAGARAAKLRTGSSDWMTVAAKHDPVDLDWVIANLEIRRVDAARDRAAVLARWPDDPRLAPAILRLLVRTGLTGRASRPYWTILFRAVHGQLHHGVAAAIADVDAAELEGDWGDYVDGKLRALRREVAKLRPEPPLDAATRALVDALHAKLEIAAAKETAKSLDDFLHEIWAAPLDDGLREVFADWLLARGDPWGELIMLQMTRKRRGLDPVAQKREAKLLREHARTWIGPIEPAVDRKQFRFEGGFLYACRINPRGMTAPLLAHPAWSTVREYVLEGANEDYFDDWLDAMIARGAKRR